MKRSSALLMPIFSLPGRFGCGGFGPESRHFIQLARAAGFGAWIILPINEPGFGNSPYQCYSSFAGNPLYIDLDQLVDLGLLSPAECDSAAVPHQSVIDYEQAWQQHERLLRLAYERLTPELRGAVDSYQAHEAYWLSDYSLFKAIKSSYGGAPWWEWPDEGLRQFDRSACDRFRLAHGQAIHYYVFQQYLFDLQWKALMQDVHAAGLKLIGDLPIYVAGDSADVWAHRSYFEVDADGRFSRVAGVPPDAYSADGQLWGNPLYNWPVLQANRYDYWVRRLGRCMELYDMVRIDHFRGFEAYWAVPYGESTAVNGSWEKGPGMDLFDVLLEAYSPATIIAEDLGFITEEVKRFLDATGFAGMMVMEFNFDPNRTSGDRLHSYETNKVAFSSTHDSEPLMGWLQRLQGADWELIRDYFGITEEDRQQGGPGSPAVRRLLLTLWQSVANLTIAPMQDLLGLDGEWTINRPGSASGNWQVRLSREQLDQLDCSYYYRLNQVTQRLNNVLG